MRTLHLLFALILTSAQLDAQCCTIKSRAEKVMTLKITASGGTNGSAIVYIPTYDLYYAAYAGNRSFPIEVFNSDGKSLYSTAIGFDTRGMWWDAETGRMISNGYSSYGIWVHGLDSRGYPTGTGTRIHGRNQPNAQSVGTFNPLMNEVWYFASDVIQRYDMETNQHVANLKLHGIPVPISSLNNTSLIFTECRGMELGLLDYRNKRIHFFNPQMGDYVGTCQLPRDAVVNNQFRFSYANGLVWLYDTATRTWTGYRVFEQCM